MRALPYVLPLALFACTTDVRRPPAPPSTTQIQASLDDAQIRQSAAELADDLDIDGAQRSELMTKLDTLLADDTFEAERGRDPVRAIGVYRYGAGGFVVKVGRGDGRIRTADGSGAQPFVIDLRGAGAMVGGQSSWGVVLALGLDSAAELEGKYAGLDATATALDETTGALRLEHRAHHHELWFVGVGEGLSANAGAEGLRFSFGTPE